jgi:cyclopropane-fatty-acyl-phospholipid synthase
MFSFGELDKKCLVKSVLRVHDPLFYWKVHLPSKYILFSFGGCFLALAHAKTKCEFQVATEADLGLADAYINGYFSFVDKREGLLNLFLVN